MLELRGLAQQVDEFFAILDDDLLGHEGSSSAEAARVPLPCCVGKRDDRLRGRRLLARPFGVMRRATRIGPLCLNAVSVDDVRRAMAKAKARGYRAASPAAWPSAAMTRFHCRAALLTLAIVSAAPLAQASDVPPTEGAALLKWLQSGAYKAWPKESAAHRSMGEHKTLVQTYLNPTVDKSLGAKAKEHPRGSAAVKELMDPAGKLSGWAVAVKTAEQGDGAQGLVLVRDLRHDPRQQRPRQRAGRSAVRQLSRQGARRHPVRAPARLATAAWPAQLVCDRTLRIRVNRLFGCSHVYPAAARRGRGRCACSDSPAPTGLRLTAGLDLPRLSVDTGRMVGGIRLAGVVA